MSSKPSLFILIGTLLGVVAGGLIGHFWPDGALSLEFIGQLFLNALRFLVIPLILISIIVGMASLGTARRAGRTIGVTLIYFLGTTAVAIIIGIALVNIIGPGFGADSSGLQPPPQVQQARGLGVATILATLIPANYLNAMMSGHYFAIILFALILGTVMATMGHRRRALVDPLRVGADALTALMRWLMYVAPFGLFCLMASIFARQAQAGQSWEQIGGYFLTLGIGLVLFFFVVLPLVLRYFGNRPLVEYFTKVLPALATGFGTGSSAASLPATHHCVVGSAKVDNRAAAVVLPLGATLNVGATAMYVVIAAIFAAQTQNISVSISQILIIGLGALVATLGTASIPHAGMLIVPLLLGMADMPDGAYASLALVVVADWLVDRLRTVTNLWSDAVGSSVVARQITSGVARSSRPPRKRSGGDPRRDSRQRPDRSDRGSRRDSRPSSSRQPRQSRPSPRQDSPPKKDQTPPPSQPTPPPADNSPFELEKEAAVDLSHPPAGGASDSRGRDSRQSRSSSGDRSRGRSGSSRNRGQSRSSGRPQSRERGPSNRPQPPRKSQPAQAQQSKPEPDKSDNNYVERETARLQAQLEELDNKIAADTKSLKRAEVRSDDDSPPTRSEPQIDYAAEDVRNERAPQESSVAVAEQDSKPEAKPEPSKPEADVKAESEEEKEIAYGRRRRNKRPESEAKSKPKSDTNADDEAPQPLGDFSSEKATFGRARKKRERR